MKDIISVLIIVFIFQILIGHVEFYILTCPSEANWNIRAQVKCNSTSKYFCLYNSVNEIYVEGCNGPDWDRKGSKRIFSGSFTRGNCSQNRYQPFMFWTHESSDCFYAKSICSEEGQLVSKEHSTKNDRACRCDYTRNYSFIKTPRNRCYCIPTEEDCSCYIKQCLVNNTLSADYECIERGYLENTKCKEINKHREVLDSIEQVSFEIVPSWQSETILTIDRKISRAVIIMIILTLLFAVTIVLAFLILKVLKPIERTSRCNQKCHKGNLSMEEMNFLRLVYLLFKIEHSVVRTIFDNVVEPNQLRPTLDRHKALLVKNYGDTQNGINDFQWNLLFEPPEGKKVSSQDFDIRLMILLLSTLANCKISDFYEDKSDTSITEKFSRINPMRKEIALILEGKVSKSQIIQYRDKISQTVQDTKSTLADEHNANGQAETQIDCLGLRYRQKDKDFQLLEETTVPTIEENNFLVVFYVIASIVYPFIQNAYCSEEESKNLNIRMMLDTLKQRAKKRGQSDYIIHFDVIRDIQREIVQSCNGVLSETRFHEILKSLRKAVLYLGGTFSEDKLSELQQIKNILE